MDWTLEETVAALSKLGSSCLRLAQQRYLDLDRLLASPA
jgi:hypothetical protein